MQCRFYSTWTTWRLRSTCRPRNHRGLMPFTSGECDPGGERRNLVKPVKTCHVHVSLQIPGGRKLVDLKLTAG
jgi:hypothetical protein